MFPAVAARRRPPVSGACQPPQPPCPQKRAPIFFSSANPVSFVFCSTVVIFLSVLILLLFLKFILYLPVTVCLLLRISYHTFLDRLKYTDIADFPWINSHGIITQDHHVGKLALLQCSLPVLFEISIGSVDRNRLKRFKNADSLLRADFNAVSCNTIDCSTIRYEAF